MPMQPIATIVTALAAGAAAARQDRPPPTMATAYAALKELIRQRYAFDQDVADALDKLEQRPASQPRQAALNEELQRVQADRIAGLVRAAHELLALLAQPGPTDAATGIARPSSSIMAPGGGTLAAGEGNVVAGGNISGSTIITGQGNLVGPGAGRTAEAVNPAPGAGPLIPLLFLAANPIDTDQLRLDGELRAIDGAMRQGAFRDRFDLRSHWAVRLEELPELLLRYRPAVVHFSGHSSAGGEIILEDQQRRTAPVPAAALADLFRIFQDDVRCVVLNACYSAAQAAGIAAHIDTVVGMSAAIPDEDAHHFAAAFYRALAYGRSVETAFALGLAGLSVLGLAPTALPQLLGKADPAGVRLVTLDPDP